MWLPYHPHVKNDKKQRQAWNPSLSARGSELRAGGALAYSWKAILGDFHNEKKTPDGIVKLRTSENVSESDVVKPPIFYLDG